MRKACFFVGFLMLALCLLAPGASAANNTTATNTTTPQTTNICGFSGASLTYNSLSKGDTAPPVCLAVGTVNVSSVGSVFSATNKTQFFPSVDEFTLLEVATPNNRSQGLFLSGNYTDKVLATGIRIQIGNVLSPIKRYRYWTVHTDSLSKKTTIQEYVVPFFTIIVFTDGGNVVRIGFDEGCNTCSGDACVDDICAIKREECGNGQSCNLKVYTTWFGTDHSGFYMTSSGLRFSRFQQYSLGSFYRRAADTASQAQPPSFSSTPTPAAR